MGGNRGPSEAGPCPLECPFVKAVTDEVVDDGQLHRPATIADVARGAGVSEATVSRALRNLPHVRDEVRQRVRDVASNLSYVADPNASRLASGRTKTVGLIARHLDTWYVSQVSTGLEDILQPADQDLLISALSTPDRRRDLIAGTTNLNQRVDGVVVVDAFLGASWKRARGERPIVIVGERVDGEHTLGIDDEFGGSLAAKHLVELGHRRLATIGSRSIRDRFSPVSKLRLKGFRSIVAEAGLEPAIEYGGEYTIESGAAAARKMLAMAPGFRPTAVFCLSDEMAFGALQVARELGVNVPGELAVVGFDGHSVAEAFGLTTVHQPVRDLGRRAAERMLGLLDDPKKAPGHEVLNVELRVRSSTVG